MQMPLCWRCTGILAGASLLVIWLFTRKRLPPLIASSSLALLLPLDVLINSLGYADSANARRLVTGVLWGVFGVSVNLHLARWCYGLWARPGTGFQSQDSAPGPVKDGAV